MKLIGNLRIHKKLRKWGSEIGNADSPCISTLDLELIQYDCLELRIG